MNNSEGFRPQEPEKAESSEVRERKEHVARELSEISASLGFADSGNIRVADVLQAFKDSPELGITTFGSWQDSARTWVDQLPEPTQRSAAAFGLLVHELIIRMDIDEEGFYEGLQSAIENFYSSGNGLQFQENLRMRLEALW